MKEQEQLSFWLKETIGMEDMEIPENLFPVFSALKNKMAQDERKIRALSRQKNLFTLLVNGTVDMFMLFSADLSVNYVSPNMEFLLGLSLEEVRRDIGLFFRTALESEECPDPEKLLAIPLGDSVGSLSIHVNQRTGEQRWYQKTIYHFYLDNEHKFIMVIS